MARLDGRVALLTGGAKGIGRHYAHRLAAEGSRLMIADIADGRELADRDARSAIGQLADGRLIFVAVDGNQPGFSVGLTSFSLAQTMVRLGAVTAASYQIPKLKGSGA